MLVVPRADQDVAPWADDSTQLTERGRQILRRQQVRDGVVGADHRIEAPVGIRQRSHVRDGEGSIHTSSHGFDSRSVDRARTHVTATQAMALRGQAEQLGPDAGRRVKDPMRPTALTSHKNLIKGPTLLVDGHLPVGIQMVIAPRQVVVEISRAPHVLILPTGSSRDNGVAAGGAVTHV